MKYPKHPESLMMSHGYNPHWSEGAVKVPIFQTSTFEFSSAEEGKAFFEVTYGLRERKPNEHLGLIYSRVNNPDLEVLENRLTLWDRSEDAAVFASGMAAISTVFMEFLRPGDLLVYSMPVYGGTAHFIQHILTAMGVHILPFTSDMTQEEIAGMVVSSGKAEQLAMVYIETPANPTNTLIDLKAMCSWVERWAKGGKKPVIAVDNTYLGPIWQHPLELGADLVIYSATKYIGGHSDVIAGAVLGNTEHLHRIKNMRTFLGNMATPYTGWLLMRSLETLKLRMDRQAKNAQMVAAFLQSHPAIDSVNYLGLLTKSDGDAYRIYTEQCKGPGAMVSLYIKGGEKEAFRFLNALSLVKLAVSLGSTESLAQHPASMTHAGMDPVQKERMGITDNLVRLSVGVEHIDDLIQDLSDALEAVVPSSTVLT